MQALFFEGVSLPQCRPAWTAGGMSVSRHASSRARSLQRRPVSATGGTHQSARKATARHGFNADPSQRRVERRLSSAWLTSPSSGFNSGPLWQRAEQRREQPSARVVSASTRARLVGWQNAVAENHIQQIHSAASTRASLCGRRNDDPRESHDLAHAASARASSFKGRNIASVRRPPKWRTGFNAGPCF